MSILNDLKARRLFVVALAGALSLAIALTGCGGTTPSPSQAGAPGRYLLVIDFLAYAADALASDPISGSPDAADLTPIIGDPSAFGVTVTDLVDIGPDASSRCGIITRDTLETLMQALNPTLPVDQRIDPGVAITRSLLHWERAEGYASLRIFRQDNTGRPSCADAGKAF